MTPAQKLVETLIEDMSSSLTTDLKLVGFEQLQNDDYMVVIESGKTTATVRAEVDDDAEGEIDDAAVSLSVEFNTPTGSVMVTAHGAFTANQAREVVSAVRSRLSAVNSDEDVRAVYARKHPHSGGSVLTVDGAAELAALVRAIKPVEQTIE